MSLAHAVGLYRELSGEQRESYLDLVVPRFLAVSHPTPADFGRFFGVAPGTPEYDVKYAEHLARAREINIANAVEDVVITLVTARRPDGTLVALAAHQIARGALPSPIAETIGSPASTLPTHRMFRGFHYPQLPGFDPAAVPESGIGEYARLVVADRDAVRSLVASGALSAGQGEAILRHAMFAVLAATFLCDQARAAAPAAYITNTRARLVRVVARLGLYWRPLFAEGAEPAPRMLQPTSFNFPYWDWATILRPYVPADVLTEGVAAAVGYLARHDRELLLRLPLSLPWLLRVDAGTREVMRRWSERYRLAGVTPLRAH